MMQNVGTILKLIAHAKKQTKLLVERIEIKITKANFINLLTILKDLVTCADNEDILSPRVHEIDQQTLNRKKEDVITVVGRLKQRLKFWKETLGASTFVSSIIEFGYFMPFTEEPAPFYAKNNQSSVKHAKFVEEAIELLLENKCIIEKETRSYCCNPLTVAEGSKLRLVIDLRHVNKYVKKY